MECCETNIREAAMHTADLIAHLSEEHWTPDNIASELEAECGGTDHTSRDHGNPDTGGV